MAKGGKREMTWYNERKYMVIIGGVALVLAFFLGSSSLDTGAWWEYLLTLIFLVLAFNRFIAAVKDE